MVEDIFIVNDSNFEKEILKYEKPALVDFWASWCSPCRAIAPIVEEMALKYKDKIRISKLNVDENQKIPSKYGIRGIPTLLLFKDGEVIESIVGVVPKSQVEEMIRKAI